MKTILTSLHSGLLKLFLFFFLITNSLHSSACNMQLTATASYTCTGNNKDGKVTLNITNGTSPYIVTFDGATQLNITVNQLSFSGLGGGTYYYSVIDANLCEVDGSVMVARNTLPSAKVAANQSECANAGHTYSLGFNPVSGNTYSWTSKPTGFTSTSSNPSVTPTITTTYTLVETNGNGCSKSNAVIITLTPIPTASITADENLVCVGGNPFSLHGRPKGGVFTGDGLTDSIFDPSYAGTGNHKIVYTYTDGNGCYSSASTTITVIPLPTVNISAPYTTMCIDAGLLHLTPHPSGGVFVGDGMTDSIFDPQKADVGDHTITYYYSSGNGCSFSEYLVLTVNPLPVLNFNPVTVCQNNGTFAIQSTPSGTGAVYSGDGVSGNTFDPAAAGVGLHTISFSYTDANGCSNATSTTFKVLPIPSVSLGSYANVCFNNGSFTLTGGLPKGGTYSGDGVSSGVFNPANAGAGMHTIYYTIIDGCPNTASTGLQVYALPVLSLPAKSVCIDAGSFTINASPVGGTLSGTGVSGTSFNPSTAGVGQHTINYTYTDAKGCTNSTSTTYTVNALPVVSISSYNPVCINGGSFSLTGTPTGGTFSGNGVSNGIFDPALAGVGSSTITYTYTNSNSCTNSAITTIVVNDKPAVTINSYSPVCANATSFSLSGTPSGGTFSGNGVSGSTFSPIAAGAGSQTVTYTYTNNSGCSNTASTTIVVNSLPVVSLASHAAVCVNGGSFSLSGSPTGGTYSGTGVSGSSFNPSVSGVGSFTVTYTYANTNGCSASASTTIVVNAIPSVSISSYPAVCINSGSFALSGSPSGGTFSGNGVSNGMFDPSVAGAGSSTITYTYSNSNGCTNSATTSIVVNDKPTVTINSYSPVCSNAASFSISGTPSGGTFSGNGVSGSTFSPIAAGAGSQTVTYTYTNNNGCSNAASTTITVNAAPVVTLASHSAVCTNGGSFSLSGSPSGGTYSGTGVSGSTFDPSSSGAGSFIVTYTYTNSNGCTASASTTIVVNAIPTVTVSSYPAVCINSGSFALSGSPSGGTFSGNGVSGGYFDPSVAGLGSSTVTYTYSNGNGCTNSATTNIKVVPAITVSFSISDIEQCLSNNSFSFTDASYSDNGTISSWVWDFGDNSSSSVQNPVHTYSTAGTYTVKLTAGVGNGGCSGTYSTTVTVDPMPKAVFSKSNNQCFDNNSFSFTDASTISSGSISLWAWDFGDNVGTSSNQNPAYTYLSSGSYSVSLQVISDNGCISSSTSTVIVYPKPTASFSSNTSAQCLSGDAISFTDGSSITSGNIASRVWNFGDNATSSLQNPNHTYSAAGNYTVTLIVFSDNGCSDTTSSTITIYALPAANAGSGSSVCAGGSANIGATEVSGNSYSWISIPSGFTSSNAFETVNPTLTTTYTLTETNTNGCSMTHSVVVKVNAYPVNNAGSDVSICIGSSATLGAASTSGSTYSWSSDPSGFSSSASNPTVSPTLNTVYTLKETNASGCSSINNITVTVNPLPSAMAGSNQTINNGSSALIGGTAISGSTYSWTSNPSGYTSTSSNPTVSPSTTTTYTLTETNENGCKASNSVIITVNSSTKPTITVGGPTTFCAGGSVKLTASSGYYYQWSNANGNISGATSQIFTATVSGTYYVTVYPYWYSMTGTTSSGVTISVIASPTANAGSSQSICLGNSLSLGGSSVCGNKYKWTGSGCSTTISTNSKITVTPLSTTTYTLTVTNSNGCSSSASVTITVVPNPTVTLASFSDVCFDAGAFTLTGGSPSGGIYKVDGVTSTSFNPSAAGLGYHTIVYTYTNSTGCSGSASQKIKVRPSIDKPSIKVQGKTTFCSGGSVSLMIDGVGKDVNFYWSNQNGPLLSAGSSKSIDVSTSGTYYLTVSSNGCSKTSDGVVVTVNPTPVVNAGSDVTYNYGFDDCPMLIASSNISGASYKWSTGDKTQSVTVCPTRTTNYWVTATKNGCTSDKSSVKVYVRDVHCDKKDKDHDKKCIICHYDSNKKKWGHTAVYKSDVDKCKKAGDKFDDCDDFGDVMPELTEDNQINIFPNPFTSTTTINLIFAQQQQVSLELWSLDGKLVKTIFKGNVTDHIPYNYSIDGYSLLPGIYFVRIIGESHVDYRKIELVR